MLFYIDSEFRYSENMVLFEVSAGRASSILPTALEVPK